MLVLPQRRMEDLRDLHAGETAWIVGKGPSLRNLRADHFGEGPIIAMNEAIVIVQDFELSNPLYAMEKDGCTFQPCICKANGNGKALVSLNESTTLFLQRPGSAADCFPMHQNTIYVHASEMGLPADSMSIRMCAFIARLMGCSQIVFVACDSLTNGDVRRVNFWNGEVVKDHGSGHYLPNNPRLLNDLGEFPYRCITPESETA